MGPQEELEQKQVRKLERYRGRDGKLQRCGQVMEGPGAWALTCDVL